MCWPVPLVRFHRTHNTPANLIKPEILCMNLHVISLKCIRNFHKNKSESSCITRTKYAIKISETIRNTLYFIILCKLFPCFPRNYKNYSHYRAFPNKIEFVTITKRGYTKFLQDIARFAPFPTCTILVKCILCSKLPNINI